MSMRDVLDISAYLVLGPENTLGRPVADIAGQAISAGFTCVQVRSKECSARELIACTAAVADGDRRLGATDRVALLVDDRLDVVYAARQQGVKVDGVHVGQTDIPVEACRSLLGHDAIVGLSARADEMLEYVKTADMSLVDYLGVGPLHETPTKRDCGLASDGTIITKSLDDLRDTAYCQPGSRRGGRGSEGGGHPAGGANRRRWFLRRFGSLRRRKPPSRRSRTRKSLAIRQEQLANRLKFARTLPSQPKLVASSESSTPNKKREARPQHNSGPTPKVQARSLRINYPNAAKTRPPLFPQQLLGIRKLHAAREHIQAPPQALRTGGRRRRNANVAVVRGRSCTATWLRRLSW